jgi:hypothetical protein
MQMNRAIEGTEAIHPFAELANTGSALNIRVYLRLTVFFWDQTQAPPRPAP